MNPVDFAILKRRITAWVTENVSTLGAVVVDNTLSQQGAVADAKKVGDEVGSVKQDVATLQTGKANTSHTHTQSDIAGLDTALSNKQNKLVAGTGITIASDGKTISADDGEKWRNRLLAVSEAKNVVVSDLPLEKSIVEEFIDNNRLRDVKAVDICKIVEDGSTKYYTSFDTAISDINSGTFTNAVSTSSGAVCKVAVDEDGLNAVCLLSDISITANIKTEKPLIIDMNGKTMSMTTLYIWNNASLCVYGMRAGSKINRVENSQIPAFFVKNSIFFIGCAVIDGTERVVAAGKAALGIFIGLNSPNGVKIEFTNSTYNCVVGDANVCLPFFLANGGSNICLNIHNSSIQTKYHVSAGENGVRYPPIMFRLGQNGVRLNIKNSTIEARHKDFLDSETPGAIWLSPGSTDCVATIDNSYIYGSNNAFQTNGQTWSVSNSVIAGTGHGGIYASNSSGANGIAYFKNCTINLEYDELQMNNPYACYIGYDAEVHFDNCKFTTYNGSGAPAIKTGSDSTATYNNTRAYFSNCEMGGIRVDGGTRAYMGLGMSDSLKQLSVNGEIIDTGRESYSFNLIEEHVDSDELSTMLEGVLV